MRQFFAAVAVLGLMTLAGCGDSIHWFPDGGGGGGGITPSPPPPGDTTTYTQVQCDTDIKFTPYTVAFGNITSSATTTSISVSGDPSSQYSKDGGTTFTSTAGTVKGGDAVVVKHTSSIYGPNRSISTLLYIGGASATYSSTTGQLSFATRKGVSAGSTATSDTATVPVNLPNGFTWNSGNTAKISLVRSDSDATSEIHINGNSVPAADGTTIAAGNTIYLKHTASSNATTLTHALITGAGGTPYDITFKSTLQ